MQRRSRSLSCRWRRYCMAAMIGLGSNGRQRDGMTTAHKDSAVGNLRQAIDGSHQAGAMIDSGLTTTLFVGLFSCRSEPRGLMTDNMRPVVNRGVTMRPRRILEHVVLTVLSAGLFVSSRPARKKKRQRRHRPGPCALSRSTSNVRIGWKRQRRDRISVQRASRLSRRRPSD